MTTKTDFHAIMELKEAYRPTQRGIVSGAEAEKIMSTLEIKSRNDIELQNVRDMTVMLYSRWSERMREKEVGDSCVMELMDAMSAICCVIDVVNRITLEDEKSGEFEAGDNKRNMVTFKVDDTV